MSTVHSPACPHCKLRLTDVEVRKLISVYALSRRKTKRKPEMVTCRCCGLTMTRHEKTQFHICAKSKMQAGKWRRLLKSIRLPRPGPNLMDDPRDAFPGRRVLRCDAIAALDAAIEAGELEAKRFEEEKGCFFHRRSYHFVDQFYLPGFVLESLLPTNETAR